MKIAVADRPFGILSDAEAEALEKNAPKQSSTTIFESKTSWVGPVAEDLFEMWLKEMKTKYRRYAKGAKADFAVHDFQIDVKTMTIYYNNRENSVADVAEVQFQKNPIVTHYVFARYMRTEKRLYLAGWLSRKEFGKHAANRFRKKGERCAGGFIAPCDMRDVPIDVLHWMDELLPNGADLQEKAFIRSLDQVTQAIIAETKIRFPGWRAVYDETATLTGYAWERGENGAGDTNKSVGTT